MLISAIQVAPRVIHLFFSDNLSAESVGTLSHYTLDSFSGGVNIESAYLIYGRKVVLILDGEGSGDSVTVTDLLDVNGNIVDLNYNSANVESLDIIPHLVGSFNSWDPANHDYDLILDENNIWELNVTLPPGFYEYKVIESEDWDENDWPGVDQTITLPIATDVTFMANCGFNTGVRNWDEFVSHENPIIMGNFLDTLDLGNNWDPLNIAGTMDDNGDGIFTWEILLPEGDWEYKVVLNQNWDQDTYGGGGNYSVSSDGSSSTIFHYEFHQNYTYHIDTCPTLGDMNSDDFFNVLDIVTLANCVLAENCSELEYGCAGDLNSDGLFNVLDIVTLANCVLAENCSGRMDDASQSRLIIKDNMVSIKADGFIGGVQMTLSHGIDFKFKMTDRAYLADYITEDNQTRLLVITPETNELFSYNGDFEIAEIIVANSHEEVSVDLPVASSLSLSQSFPNPFNPITTMELTMPAAGSMQVEVYNLLGQSVATLATGYKKAGTYTLIWNATDASSGVYFVKAEAEGFTTTQKLMLLK